MKDKVINILAISGSLKSNSTNTNILRVISKIASQNVIINIFDGLDKLPHFNPGSTNDIESVNDFMRQLRVADAVIFSTPEYAFGVPGVLKNALDWLVSSGELNKKPIVAISASPLYSGGDKALASLLLTLTALGTNMHLTSSLSIGSIKNKMNETGAITDQQTMEALELILKDLIDRIAIL